MWTGRLFHEKIWAHLEFDGSETSQKKKWVVQKPRTAGGTSFWSLAKGQLHGYKESTLERQGLSRVNVGRDS